MGFRVNRCICFKVSFGAIDAKIKELDLKTLKQVQAAVPCAAKCKLCVPYIKDLLNKNNKNDGIDKTDAI